MAEAVVAVAVVGTKIALEIKAAQEAKKAREQMGKIQSRALASEAKRRKKEMELQKKSAGEYYEISKKQMEIILIL